MDKYIDAPTQSPPLTTVPPTTSSQILIGESKLAPTARAINNVTTEIVYDRNEYMFQITTWFSLLFIAVFVLTGILHGSEVFTLIYGILYWLCLPTGHLLLTIYSIANLTDRSWGKFIFDMMILQDMMIFMM